MLKQFKIASFRLWAFVPAALAMSACGTLFAGGVSEETNTVAGASADEAQSPDPQVNLEPTENSRDVDIIVDTAYLPPRQDIKTPPVNTIINVDPTPTPADTVSEGIPISIKKVVKVYLADNGANASMELSLRDSVAVIQSGANGAFEIEDLPDGTYSFVLKYNGYGHVSETAYFLKHESDSVDVLGPVPTGIAEDIDADDLIAPPVQTVEMPDVVGCTPSPDPVEPEPDPDPSCDTITYFGNVDGKNDGKDGPTVEMPHDLDYGIVYHWESDNVPANGSTVEDNLTFANDLKELTFEVTFKINSFMESTFYSRNIFGKKGLFNLAITKSACYVPRPALTFFIGNGFEFSSCYDKAVVSSATLEAGKEITVTGVWKGKQVMLYMDGFLIAEQTLTQISDINYITADNILETPFTFGSEDLDITILDARLGNKAITSADVLYRHYLKGGAK